MVTDQQVPESDIVLVERVYEELMAQVRKHQEALLVEQEQGFILRRLFEQIPETEDREELEHLMMQEDVVRRKIGQAKYDVSQSKAQWRRLENAFIIHRHDRLHFLKARLTAELAELDDDLEFGGVDFQTVQRRRYRASKIELEIQTLEWLDIPRI